MRLKHRVACVGLALVMSTVASAHIIVHFDPVVNEVDVGDTVMVDVLADISDPIVGWGLDLTMSNPGVASMVPPPVIGPLWDGVVTPDGDGLAGLSLDGIVGDDVLLATIEIQGDMLGTTFLGADVTPGDLTEGFALDPVGFDTWTVCNALITVVPEPASLALLGLAGFALLRRR